MTLLEYRSNLYELHHSPNAGTLPPVMHGAAQTRIDISKVDSPVIKCATGSVFVGYDAE